LETKKDLVIPPEYMDKWQSLVNDIAELIDVPTGLIMRVIDENIHVFVSSETQGNPYKPGDHEVLNNSGLYCETVIRTNSHLLVPNARTDDHWKNNPDVKLNMISYLGLPILKPDQSSFGTICILDNKENHYSELFIKIMRSFKEIIENDLKMVYMNQVLGARSKKLMEFIAEIQQLRGILRICAHCMKIKDEEDNWVGIENYVEKHSDAEFSHGLCESCLAEIYGDQEWYKKRFPNA